MQNWLVQRFKSCCIKIEGPKRPNTLRGEGRQETKEWDRGTRDTPYNKINKRIPAPTHSQRACPRAGKHAKDPTGYWVLWNGSWGILILQISQLLPKLAQGSQDGEWREGEWQELGSRMGLHPCCCQTWRQTWSRTVGRVRVQGR